MFEGFKSWVKGVINRMFSATDIEKVAGQGAQLSEVMVERLELWSNMYRGLAPWAEGYVKSLRIEAGICREFANVVLNEMESEVSNEQLNEIYKKGIRNLNENLQSGLATGSFIIKPIGTDGAEFITGDKIIPMGFDLNGNLTDCFLVQVKKISKAKYYFRFERHTLENGGLTIRNTAFKSSDGSNLGGQASLSDVTEWEKLPEEIHYPGMEKMDFGYYRNPLKNEVDGSQCGVSIYENAIDAIKRADVQGAGLDWEFESGERAIHVDESVIARDRYGNADVAKLNKRLYRGLSADSVGKEELFKEYSPEFRDQSILNGLEEYYRQVEFIVGLSYGDLSKPQAVEKTATEVRAAKQRKYNMTTAIQDNLKDCLTDFVDAIAFYAGKLTTGYEYTCSFKDSILTDEESERKQDMADVSAGFMKHWEYRMKWYGEDEATAKKMTDVDPDDVQE